MEPVSMNKHISDRLPEKMIVDKGNNAQTKKSFIDLKSLNEKKNDSTYEYNRKSRVKKRISECFS
jgi:hypothetical protein